MDELEVSCLNCNLTYHRPPREIRVELDEQCEWDGDKVVDCWWIHDYYTDCPRCTKEVAVLILSPHSCCLD